MASLALNGFLKGMVTSPSDKILFERTLAQSSQEHQSLAIITESDTTDDDYDDIINPDGNGSDIFYAMSDESDTRDSFSGQVVSETGKTEGKQLFLDESQVQNDHRIIKNESRGTLKSVTFLPKEKKPLLSKQESFEHCKDDKGSFTGCK